MSLSTGIIRGTPTQAGTSTVDITAYEFPNQQGPNVSFTLTFEMTGGASPPTITTQPSGGTVVEGGSFTFTVVAAGTGLSFQWQHTGTVLAGSNSSTLTLNPVTLADAGTYSVAVSNSAGTVTSTGAMLNVTPAVVPLVITTQPANVTLHSGEGLRLTVVATGPDTLNYQWQRNGTALPGQTAATLTIAAVTPADAGDYTAVVSSASSTLTSTAAAVTVIPLSIRIQGLSAGAASLTLETIPGRQYVVEAADTLSGAVWQTVGTPTASAATTVFTDPAATGNQRFWRYRTP